jgi:hypothetical protein
LAALAVGVLAAGVEPGPAQVVGSTDAAADRAAAFDKPALFVGFGFSASSPAPPPRSAADLWVPVVLTVQAGARPFEGLVVVEFQQDATQVASIATPVAATPGRSSTVRVPLPIPPMCQRVEFSLIDRDGRTHQRLVYSVVPTRDELPLPPLYSAGDGGAWGRGAPLAVGAPGGPASSISVLATEAGTRTPRPRDAGAAVTNLIRPEDVPLSWPGLDAVNLLVVEADAAARMDPRSLAAVREWVSAGGRLVILATAATTGREWRLWLPPAAFGSVVSVEEPSTGPVPDDLARALRARPSSIRSAGAARGGRLGGFGRAAVSPSRAAGLEDPAAPFLPIEFRQSPVRERPDDAGPGADPLTADAPRPAESFPRRLIRLTPEGRSQGWRLRWTYGSDAEGGLLADGPVGFGWVAIVGVDPRRAAAVVTNRATLAVWEDLLDPVRDSIVAADRGTSAFNQFYADTSLKATQAVLDSLSDVPSVGHGAFVVIAAAMAALALLVGPGDAWWLGRLRRRHRSWMTSIAWIVLAAVVAYKAPLLGRGSSPTVVNRASVVDAVMPAAEGPGSSPAPLAWHTSFIGVFAGEGGVHEFEGPALAGGGSVGGGGGGGGSWWKGVSAVSWWGQEQRITSARVAALLSLPDLASIGASDDPWGGWPPPSPSPSPSPDPTHVVGAGARGGGGGCRIGPTPMSLWTFRTFQDRGRTVPPCHARLVQEGGTLVAVLSGLPPGATIRAAACRTAGAGEVGWSWHALAFVPDDARAGRGSNWRAPLGPPTATPPPPWTEPTPDRYPAFSAGYGPVEPGALARFLPVAFMVPGAAERTAGIDRLLSRARVACLYLVIDHAPPDVTVRSAAPSASHSRTIYARLLVPLPPHPREDDAGESP